MGLSSIPELVTERLRLRPFTSDDVDDWARLLFADPEVTRYLISHDITPRERAERTLRFFLDNWAKHGYGEWAVTDRQTGEFMGQCGLTYLEELGETELDYSLARRYWGRGYATEAGRASVNYGVETLGLTQLVGFVIPGNVASQRVLEHLGFRYERTVHQWGVDLMRFIRSAEC